MIAELYPNSTFLFEAPYASPYIPGLTVFMAVYLVLTVVNCVLLYRFRHHRMVAIRVPGTQVLGHVFGWIASLVLILSILLGKPAWCIANDVVYVLFFPVNVLHLFLLQPIVLTAWKLNTLKESRAQGEVSWIWRLQHLLSTKAQFLYIGAFAAVEMAVYLGLRFGTNVQAQFDDVECNRTALLVSVSFCLLFAALLLPFGAKLAFMEDPYFFRPEVFLTMTVLTPCVLMMLIYPIDPLLFPSWFDFRWVVIVFSVGSMLGAGYVQLILMSERVQNFIRPQKPHRSSSFELRTLQDHIAVITGNGATDLFLACLKSPILLQGFMVFTKKNWCIENVLFWLEINRYKELVTSSSGGAQEKGRSIISDFVTHGSALEINIDSETRRALMQVAERGDFTEATLDSFEKAEREVFELMEKDSFEKWRKTGAFEDCVEKAAAGKS